MRKIIVTLGLLGFWAINSEAKTYTCTRLDGSGSYQLVVQPPSWFSGQFIKLLDMNDGYHGPTYPYEGTIVDAPEGVPTGSYVFTRISGILGGLGLILDSELYNGANSGTIATTVSDEYYSVRTAYNCQAD